MSVRAARPPKTRPTSAHVPPPGAGALWTMLSIAACAATDENIDTRPALRLAQARMSRIVSTVVAGRVGTSKDTVDEVVQSIYTALNGPSTRRTDTERDDEFNVRVAAGHTGFCVGVAFAYHLLAAAKG